MRTESSAHQTVDYNIVITKNEYTLEARRNGLPAKSIMDDRLAEYITIKNLKDQQKFLSNYDIQRRSDINIKE